MQPTAVLKTPKGFTLIEVLSVVVIIGILAAIAVPSYKATMDRSREKAAEAAIAEVKSRLSLAYAKYLLEEKSEPDTIGDIAGIDDSGLPAGSGEVPQMDNYTVTLSGHNGTTATITVTKIKDVDYSQSDEIDNTWELP